MKRHAIAALLAIGLHHAATLADTLELADGTLLEGDFVGMSNGIIMFNTGDGIEAFPEDQVVGIFNSEGVATREQQAAARAEVGLGASILTRGASSNIPAGTILESQLRTPLTLPR
jgi:hypothetical protein